MKQNTHNNVPRCQLKTPSRLARAMLPAVPYDLVGPWPRPPLLLQQLRPQVLQGVRVSAPGPVLKQDALVRHHHLPEARCLIQPATRYHRRAHNGWARQPVEALHELIILQQLPLLVTLQQRQPCMVRLGLLNDSDAPVARKQIAAKTQSLTFIP